VWTSELTIKAATQQGGGQRNSCLRLNGKFGDLPARVPGASRRVLPIRNFCRRLSKHKLEMRADFVKFWSLSPSAALRAAQGQCAPPLTPLYIFPGLPNAHAEVLCRRCRRRNSD
jgi:hypothetical protein